MSYKKIICILVWRAFKWKKIQIRSQDQLIFAKKAVLPEKSKLLEKIRHFEKFKNFFSWIQGLGIEVTYLLNQQIDLTFYALCSDCI